MEKEPLPFQTTSSGEIVVDSGYLQILVFVRDTDEQTLGRILTMKRADINDGIQHPLSTLIFYRMTE